MTNEAPPPLPLPSAYGDWKGFALDFVSVWNQAWLDYLTVSRDFYDNQGRVLLDGDGHHVYDEAGDEVISGETLALKGGNLTDEAVTTPKYQEDALSQSADASTAGKVLVAATWTELASVTITLDEGDAFLSASANMQANTSGFPRLKMKITRDAGGGDIDLSHVVETITTTHNIDGGSRRHSIYWLDDSPGANTYTYKFWAIDNSASYDCAADNRQIFVREIIR